MKVINIISYILASMMLVLLIGLAVDEYNIRSAPSMNASVPAWLQNDEEPHIIKGV